MHIEQYPLPSPSLGTHRVLQAIHFGTGQAGQKAYLQASLHADELPGMLVLHHLRRLLERAENEGRIVGEIVLVPVANPIGLAQSILYSPMGRFELASGSNFNRHFPDLLELAGPQVETLLGTDASRNVAAVRARVRERLVAQNPPGELEGLRLILMRLACDADVVLDLHCDSEALMHLYAETAYWPQAEPLARYLGALVSLTADDSGGASFDESLSSLWSRLDALCAKSDGPRLPVPLACLAVTVELRGAQDVDHASARRDASALFAFLQLRGLIAGTPPPLPPLLNTPTPLAGAENLIAPSAGLVVFLRQPGDWIKPGDVLAEIIDPLNDSVTPVCASVAGLLFGRVRRRYVLAGTSLCRVAGKEAFRSGPLLGP